MMGHRCARRQWAIGVTILLLGMIVTGCSTFQDTPPTVTPIYVTATQDIPIMPIVATETPSSTPVMAATDISLLPTQPTTRTPTPTAPAPMTMTPTFTPTMTDTPSDADSEGVYAPVGSDDTQISSGGGGVFAASGCTSLPPGNFGAIYQREGTLQSALGCAISGAVSSANSAYQPFQNGVMIWVSSLGTQPQPVIYVLYNNSTYQRFNDTFRDGIDPDSSGASAPPGLLEPVRGFGKIWRENSGVRDTLGWATAGESGGSAQVQLFERGEMLYTSQANQIYVLITGAPGTWSAIAGTP